MRRSMAPSDPARALRARRARVVTIVVSFLLSIVYVDVLTATVACSSNDDEGAACTRDTDCKGDRVCDNGKCVATDSGSPIDSGSDAAATDGQVTDALADVETDGLLTDAPLDNEGDSEPTDALLADAPGDAPLVDAPLVDAPLVDAPLVDAPLIDAPLIDAAPVDAPFVDAAPVDANVDAAPDA